jgi:eukaryotic-like serine/threonine-protein kinase
MSDCGVGMVDLTQNLSSNPGEPIVHTEIQQTPSPDVCRVPKIIAVGSRIGDYDLQKLLGCGGMGAVFQGFDRNLHRKVAVKVILPEYAADREARERFLREARSTAAINHDNVVTVYQAGIHLGSVYLVMPLLRGSTLEHYLIVNGPLPVRAALRVIRDVLKGLAAAHARGVIHRDIKPANVWLEKPHGRAKLLDFGLAKSFTHKGRTHLTASGVIMGTPTYMSPEQARGYKVDVRTDLYSVGSLLFRLLTGEPPFVRPTVMETLAAVVSDAPPSPMTLNPRVGPELEAFVLKLLAKSPDDRFATCSEVLRALDAVDAEAYARRTRRPTGVPSDIIPMLAKQGETDEDDSNSQVIKTAKRVVTNRQRLAVLGGLLLCLGGWIGWHLGR